MNRGGRYKAIFEGKNDYSLFLELLQETIEIFHIKIAAFCLMQNHYHLLIQTPEVNISRSMRHSNGVYTKRFNTIHGYDGHLFRGRYTSILIDADRYLLKVMRYIHRNPIKDHYFTKKTHSEVPESRLLAPGKDTIISAV